jgi:AcrR family transcriptional regulator
MAPRTEEQYEEIRMNKKALIMETALELFASAGYHETSISNIAEKAGISKGLMYNYFESKEDLIKQIIRKGMDDLLQYFDPDQDGIITKEEIRYFIDKMFAVMQQDMDFWKVYFMVLLQPPVFIVVEDEVRRPVNVFINMMKSYFETRGDEDPEMEAMVMGAILDGLGFQFILNPEHFPVEKVKNKLYKLYCT